VSASSSLPTSSLRAAPARRRAGGVPGARRARNSPEGRARVSELQRARILRAAEEVLREQGYERFSIARVTVSARVSRRTFYDLFADREDCFLAVFEEMVARARAQALQAYRAQQEGERGDWRARVRAALTALLELFDREPGLASVLIVDGLRSDTRVLEYRARVLADVSGAVHAGGVAAANGNGPVEKCLPLVTGEGVVGGVLAVLHNRLSGGQPGRLLGSRNMLMAMVVLPYLGSDAARRELDGPTPRPVRRSAHRRARSEGSSPGVDGNPLADVPMRWTYRTARVLEAVAEHSGASNRAIGEAAETYDQGQISKLLLRLKKTGLIENTASGGHQPTGEPNAWRLTPKGREIERALRANESNNDNNRPRRGRAGASQRRRAAPRGAAPSNKENT
jgi:AcrR family transcriptional regulator/DNA-binding MarR family transcriptional regulator